MERNARLFYTFGERCKNNLLNVIGYSIVFLWDMSIILIVPSRKPCRVFSLPFCEMSVAGHIVVVLTLSESVKGFLL